MALRAMFRKTSKTTDHSSNGRKPLFFLRLFMCCFGSNFQNDGDITQPCPGKPDLDHDAIKNPPTAPSSPTIACTTPPPAASVVADPTAARSLVPYSPSNASTPVALVPYSPSDPPTPTALAIVPHPAAHLALGDLETINEWNADGALDPVVLSPGLEAALDDFFGDYEDDSAAPPLDLLAWEEWQCWEEWCAVRQLREDSSSSDDEE